MPHLYVHLTLQGYLAWWQFFILTRLGTLASSQKRCNAGLKAFLTDGLGLQL